MYEHPYSCTKRIHIPPTKFVRKNHSLPTQIKLLKNFTSWRSATNLQTAKDSPVLASPKLLETPLHPTLKKPNHAASEYYIGSPATLSKFIDRATKFRSPVPILNPQSSTAMSTTFTTLLIQGASSTSRLGNPNTPQNCNHATHSQNPTRAAAAHRIPIFHLWNHHHHDHHQLKTSRWSRCRGSKCQHLRPCLIP